MTFAFGQHNLISETPFLDASSDLTTITFPSSIESCRSPKMSQAEIWDDSSLVNSWNEALEEYKVRTLQRDAVKRLT